jgi:hypothetical protein
MQCGLSDVARAMSDPTPANCELIADTQRSFMMNSRGVAAALKEKRIGVDGRPEIAVPAMQTKLENFFQVLLCQLLLNFP